MRMKFLIPYGIGVVKANQKQARSFYMMALIPSRQGGHVMHTEGLDSRVDAQQKTEDPVDDLDPI